MQGGASWHPWECGDHHDGSLYATYFGYSFTHQCYCTFAIFFRSKVQCLTYSKLKADMPFESTSCCSRTDEYRATLCLPKSFWTRDLAMHYTGQVFFCRVVTFKRPPPTGWDTVKAHCEMLSANCHCNCILSFVFVGVLMRFKIRAGHESEEKCAQSGGCLHSFKIL